jgi:hypothetical protein
MVASSNSFGSPGGDHSAQLHQSLSPPPTQFFSTANPLLATLTTNAKQTKKFIHLTIICLLSIQITTITLSIAGKKTGNVLRL